MPPNPLPYSFRWTAQLLRRDIKNLKTKLTTTFKTKFTSARPDLSIGPAQLVQIDDNMSESGSPLSIADAASIDTTDSIELQRDSSNINSPSSATTAPTELNEVGQCFIVPRTSQLTLF